MYVGEWTPILASSGSCDLANNPTLTKHNTSGSIPQDAYAVLLHVEVHSGHNPNQNDMGALKVYTVKDQQEYAFYIGTHFYEQNAWSVNSVNMWLPISSNGTVFTELIGNLASGSAFCLVHVAGYY